MSKAAKRPAPMPKKPASPPKPPGKPTLIVGIGMPKRGGKKY